MSFRDDLTSRIAEIRRTALDHFEQFALRKPGSPRSTHLSDDNTQVVPDLGLDQPSLDILQDRLDQFRSDLDMLEARVEKYLDMNRGQLGTRLTRLCRMDNTHLFEATWSVGGSPWSPSLGQQPDGGGAIDTVADRVTVAATRYVLPSADPPNMEAPPLWSGTAADLFNDTFLLPFQQVSARQVFAAVYLGNVLDIFKNIVKATQDDLIAIADATITAFKGGAPEPVGSALSNMALLTSAVGLFLPPPFDIAADLGSISLDLLSRRVHDPEPPEWAVQWSPYTEDILAGAFTELTTMEEQIYDIEMKLALAVGTDSSQWFLRLRPNAPNTPSRIDDHLAADVLSIYEIGARIFPSAAELYEEAARQADQCVLPEWFGRPFPISGPAYETARTDLANGLAETAVDIADVGRTLVDISNLYDFADTTSRDEFQTFKENLPPPEDLTDPVVSHGLRVPFI